jgi:hypothetical protein
VLKRERLCFCEDERGLLREVNVCKEEELKMKMGLLRENNIWKEREDLLRNN